MDPLFFIATRMASVVTALFLIATPLQAEIYKWTDANGKVHFSDRVPSQQQEKAESIAVSVKQLSDSDIQEAQERAVKIKNAARVTAEGNRSRAPKRKKRSYSHGSPGGPIHTMSQAKKSPKRPGSYAEAMKEYKQSQLCYERYKNLNGSNQAAAQFNCKNVARPRESDY